MRINTVSKAAFCGKKILYTDFDGTYFPFKRQEIRNNNTEIKKMYRDFDTFEKQTKANNDTFEVIVTTGRSKNDFEHTCNLFKEAGLDFYFPNGLISSNGANCFVVDKKHNFIPIIPKDDPMAQSVVDDVVSLICENNPEVKLVECKINGDYETYQDYSSESKLDEIKPLKYLSVAKDGKYNAEIVVSKKLDFEEIKDEISQYIEEKNLPFSIEAYENAIYTSGFEYDNDTKEKVNANVIFLKYAKDKALNIDKFDFTQAKIKEILDSGSDDVVFVAGDDFNDEKMLNPLNYLHLADSSLDKDDINLDNPKVMEALAKLPLKSIICGQNPKLDYLRELQKKLQEKNIDIITCAPNPKTDFANALKNQPENFGYGDFINDIKKAKIEDKDFFANIEPENLLGSGKNSDVYCFSNPLMNRWAIKVEKSASLDNISFPIIFEEIPDDFEGMNMGQEIAKTQDKIAILKRINGTPHSIKLWSQVRANKEAFSGDEVENFVQNLETISNFPQKTFDNFASRLKEINEKGYKADSFNPNNYLVDYDKQEIYIIDFYKYYLDENKNTQYDLICPLLDYANFENIYNSIDEDKRIALIKSAQKIIEKCKNASFNVGLNQDEKVFVDFISTIDFRENYINNYAKLYEKTKEILNGIL